jgi:hypothetical protein
MTLNPQKDAANMGRWKVRPSRRSISHLQVRLSLWALCAVALGGIAHAGAVIEGDPADGGVLANGVNTGYYGDNLTQAVGQQYFSDVGNIVEPFALPYLAPGQTVTGATISFYLDSAASPSANVQLYGLTRVSATSPTVTTADWYVGANDTANTLLTGTFATPSTATSSTVTYSGGNLTSFIQKQYANSAFASAPLSSTRYIFFRLNPDSGGGNYAAYLFGTSRNPNRLYHPTLALTISGGLSNVAGRLQFAFNLPQQSITSAGVYNPSTGALIRTLWNNIQYSAGMNYGAWDGNDDSGNAVASGTSYQIKLIYHNVQYVWAGTVGNTSSNTSGPNVHRSYLPMSDMSIGGGTAYFAVGYNELQDCFNDFTVGSPQVSNQIQQGFSDCYSNFDYVAADGTRSYWAKCGGGVGVNVTYIVALNNADGSNYTFPNGTAPSGANQLYKSCIDFNSSTSPSTPAGGLAVQQSGNDLFVSHPNLNLVRVFDKVQGTLLGSFAVTAPGRLATTANGDVWVISNATPPVVSRYTFASGKATVVQTITGLVNPVAVGVSADDSLLLVADGGASDQIKAFNNSTGASAWTYGALGGYPVQGPAINSNTFDFQTNTFVAFQADNTFWVMDTGNDRYLHFSINGSTLNYIEQIAYVPCSYCAAVDKTDPTRAYDMFFEYSINYSLPMAGTNGSWTLTHNWGYGLPNDSAHNYFGFQNGIKSAATLSNGRVYAFLNNYATGRADLFELSATGPARPTGYSFDCVPRIYSDGSLRFNVATSSSISFYSAPLTGFDNNNNPTWSTPSLLASSTVGSTDPGTWSTFPERTEVTSGGMVVDYDPSQAHTGYHMGGIPTGGSAWLWRSAPSTTSSYTGWFPRDGHFDIGNGVQYAGDVSMAMGRNIVAGYHGEFWKNGQASQWLNYFDNGLLVGVFGTFGQDVSGPVTANGFGGNQFSPDLVRGPDGNVYMYMNDESNHAGLNRWMISGWDAITEIKGTSTIGNSVSLSGGGAPTVSITAPVQAAVFDNSPSITVTADAAGSGAPIASVQFFDGSNSLGTATATPYSVTTPALAPGTHTLTALATDTLGHSAASPAVTITLGSESATTRPPAPASLAVTANSSSGISLSWSEPLVGTTSSTMGQILSFQCTSATNTNAMAQTTVAGAPNYAVANWNILGGSSSNGLIFVAPVNNAGVPVNNLGLNINVAGGGPGGSVSGLPGSAQQLFSNELWTSFNSYPAITLEFIPYAQYDLVVYSLADGSFPATAGVTVSDLVNKSVVSQTFTKNPTAYTTSTVAYGTNASVTDVNTIIFSGLTSSTIEIQGNNLAGFQVVERPYDSGTPASFSILRATGSGAFAPIGTVSGTASSYTDATAIAGTTYQYEVQAVNSVGTSASSNAVGVTASSSAPGGSSGSGGSSGTSGSGGSSGSGSGSGGSSGSSGSSSGASSSSSSTTSSSTIPFSAWQAAYFTASQLADNTISGPSADPYGSGVPNLLAYALQLNPATASPTNIPHAVISNGHLALTYLAPAGMSDVTFIVEVSTDLSTWNSGSGYTEQTASSVGATGTSITYQDTLPTTTQKHFMRLRVSQNQ